MQALLTDQELCYLLDATEPAQREAGAAGEEAASFQPRNFSGDLQDTRLAEVLETLRRTGMEGVIVVANALEEHHLWVRQGWVTDWVPSRVESRRLGRRLVRAGLLTQEQVEQAVARQQESGVPLGELLSSEGLVSQDQIDATTRDQALEDIYSLFVWTDGTIEFVAGPPGDDEQDRPADLPAFDIQEILKEAKAREAEWRPILQSLGSLNEVIVACGDGQAADLDERHELVLQALDGESSLLDVSKTTMLGLFDCALAVKDLQEWRMVGVAPTEELLSLARTRVVQGDRRKAVVLLRSLIKRRDLDDLDAVVKVAELLARCKERTAASEFLLTSAYARSSAEERLELARRAYQISPRSAKVLAYFRDRLLEVEPSADDLLSVSCSLADVMIRDGWLEEALEVLAPFPVESTDDAVAVSLRVRALCKLDRPKEAIAELVALATLCRKEEKRDQLAVIYEQILRIDSSRTDVEAALQALNRKPRVLVHGAIGAGIVLLLAGTWLLLQRGSEVDRERLRAWTATVLEKIDAGDAAAALRLLDGADTELRREPEVRQLRERVEALQTRERAQREEEFLSQMTAAADHLDASEVGKALDIYRALRTAGSEARVDKIVKARFDAVLETFEQQVEALAPLVPEHPSTLATEQEILGVLGQIDRTFPGAALARARGVLDGDQELLGKMLGQEQLARVSAGARAVVDVFDRAAARRKDYEEAHRRSDIRRKLEGLWKAAKEHEAEFDIARAHEIYAELAREYPEGKDGLRGMFASLRDRYASILRDMRDLEEVTQRGDLERATRMLEFMKRHEPDVPFARLVRLPLRVVTSPPGATVRLAGQRIGETPLLTSFVPAGEPVLRIELDGFEPVQHTVREEAGVGFDIVLTRAPAWTYRAMGVVERKPAFDGDGRVYVVDRSGRVGAFRRDTGEQLWLESTGDLSGLLPTPVVWRDRLVVTSLDGKVRCLARESAEPLWSQDGLPCESGPVVVGDVVYLATTQSELVALDPASGKPVNRAALPGPVASDLQAMGDLVYLTTSNGWLVCAEASRARRGRVAWKERVGSATVSAPCVAADLVAVGNDEGKLLALEPRTGKRLWQRQVVRGELAHSPVSAGARLIVAAHDRLLFFDRASGEPAGEFQGEEPWSAAPVLAGDTLLVGNRAGVVSVLGVEKLDLRYRLQGDSGVAGALARSRDGWLVVGFDDRTVHCYGPR